MLIEQRVFSVLPTYTQDDLAAILGKKSLKTFQNCRQAFFKHGMPQPLDIPGNPVWLRADFDAWLESRRRGALKGDQALAEGEAHAVATRQPEAFEMPLVPRKRRGRPSNQEKASLQRAAQREGGAA